MNMTKVRSDNTQHGFTLIELMIALAIFAVLSAMTYGGLRAVLNARNHSEQQAERLASLQTALLIIGRDIEQTTPRAIRDVGNGNQPAMMGGGTNTASITGSMLEFTRTGWRNPAGRARSNLQRVAYTVQNKQLLRMTWAALDQAPSQLPQTTVLLDKVNALEVRFLDQQMRWQLLWPLATTDTAAQVILPRAVEVSIDVEGWGRIPRLFSVAGTGGKA
jgi:general secretion pathway protein J